MRSFELVAAFERHRIERRDYGAFVRLIRTGRVSRQLRGRLHRRNYQACGEEIIGIEEWRRRGARPARPIDCRLYLDDILSEAGIVSEYWPDCYALCTGGQVEPDRYAEFGRRFKRALPAIMERVNQQFSPPACSAAAA